MAKGNENIEIEVFLVEDVDAQGNIVEQHRKSTIPTREKLYPLSFVKKAQKIKNGILLDTPEEELFPELDPSYVEYWFDIFCDYEIDEEVLCANQPATNTKGGFFVQDAPNCPDNGGMVNALLKQQSGDGSNKLDSGSLGDNSDSSVFGGKNVRGGDTYSNVIDNNADGVDDGGDEC